MRYTDILFDLDDTLIDTATNTKVTVEEVYYEHNLGKYFSSFDEFYPFYHTNVMQLWDAYNKGDISKEEIQHERFAVSLRHIADITDAKIQKINNDYIKRVMEKDALVDGAINLLDYLKTRYKMHILSNGFTEMQYKKMKSAGICTSYFGHIILSDVVGVNKPHPDIFHYTLNKINAEKHRVIMIGDNLSADIKGAHNSQIDQIWFNPEDKPCNENIRPTHVVRKLADIMDIL